VQLDEICAAIVDCEHKTAPEGDGYALSVGTRAMKHGRLVLDACKPVSETTYICWSRRMMPVQGDLVLAREAPVGQVIRVPRRPRICLGQRTVLIRPDAARVHPRFLHYWLLGPDAQGPMAAQAAGATVAHLNVEDIRRLDVSRLPRDRKHQQAAAESLGAIDDLIENNRRRVEVLEEMARAIYREWFVHFRYPGHENSNVVGTIVGALPDGWSAHRSRDLMAEGVLDIGDGYRAKNSEMTGTDQGLPFVRVGNVRDGWLSIAGCDRLPDDYKARLRSKVSRSGDVVISMKGTVGRHALVHESDVAMSYSPQVSYWRSLAPDVFSPTYLYLWIQSHDFIQQCAAVKGATDMADYVNLTDQRRMTLVQPSREVMARFGELVQPAILEAGVLRRQGANLSAMRDLLLPKLVTGQIDVSSLDLDALVGDSVA